MATASYHVACKLAKRMRIFKTLMTQAQERGDSHIELHRDELWDVEDEAALQAFEDLYAQHNGMQPLFPIGD